MTIIPLLRYRCLITVRMCRKNFEQSVKTVLSEAHKTYIKRIDGGEDKEAAMNELLTVSLSSLKKQMR